MRSEEEANRAIDRYADLVRRLCMVHLKNPADTEDIFQTVFLKYVLSSAVFESPEHEKAWFIRVTLNACRDLLKRFFRSRTVSLDELADQPDQLSQEHREVLEAVLSLPAKYRDVVYLHYYEGYTAKEIGAILHKNTNTVYTLLTRAREQLRSTLGGERIEPTRSMMPFRPSRQSGAEEAHTCLSPCTAHSARPRYRSLLAAAACLLVVFLGAGGALAWFTPVSAVSVEAGPSLELTLNRFDRVLQVQGDSAQDQELADKLELTYLSYTDALEAILGSQEVSQALDSGTELAVTVAGQNQQHCQDLMEDTQSCAGHGSCSSADWSQVTAAQKEGLSLSKYQMLLQLQALDPSITAEQVNGCSMHQLRQWLSDLSSGQDASSSSDCGQNTGSDQGFGSGNSGGHHGSEGHHGGR